MYLRNHGYYIHMPVFMCEENFAITDAFQHLYIGNTLKIVLLRTVSTKESSNILAIHFRFLVGLKRAVLESSCMSEFVPNLN